MLGAPRQSDLPARCRRLLGAEVLYVDGQFGPTGPLDLVLMADPDVGRDPEQPGDPVRPRRGLPLVRLYAALLRPHPHLDDGVDVRRNHRGRDGDVLAGAQTDRGDVTLVPDELSVEQ